MKLLASHGAEVACKDKKSYTPLHAAASSGMISVVKYLLDLGVDVSSAYMAVVLVALMLLDLRRYCITICNCPGWKWQHSSQKTESSSCLYWWGKLCRLECPDQRAQRVRQHAPPRGLLQRAGRGGERAHRVRSQREPSERERLRTATLYCRFAPRGPVPGAPRVQRGRRQHQGQEKCRLPLHAAGLTTLITSHKTPCFNCA